MWEQGKNNMNFFSNIKDSIKRKSEDAKDRREFLDLVEEQTKPIRRRAYLEQRKKDAINEGIEKAKADALKLKSKKKTASDFGIEDPFKYVKGGTK